MAATAINNNEISVNVVEMLGQFLDDFGFLRWFQLQRLNRRLISSFQSGMFDSGDATDCFDELAPTVALRLEHY